MRFLRRISESRSALIKLLIIAGLFLLAPFAVPFALEFVVAIDLLGLEALLLYLLLQSKQVLAAITARLLPWRDHFAATLLLLANVYLFQPKVVLSHTAGSSLILLLACSSLLACAIWIPALYLSGPGFL